MTAASLAANLGGIALFALSGLGVSELLAPLRRLPLARRLGYAYLLGILVVGGALFAASHLFGVPLRRPAIATAAVVPALLGLGLWLRERWCAQRLAAQHVAAQSVAAPRVSESRVSESRVSESQAPESRAPESSAPESSELASRRAPAPGTRRGRWWRWAVALLLVAVVLGPLLSALSSPLVDWDGRMTWSAAAAYMRAEGTVDAAVLKDERWFVVHPRYPPLLPLAQVAVEELFGAGTDEQLFRGLYFGCYAALLLVLYDGTRRVAGRSAAAVTTLCAALLPFLKYGPGGATSSYSDVALAGFYGGALVLLLAERARPAAGLAAGCLLAGAVLAKNEGDLLAVVALLLALPRLLASRRSPRLAAGRLRWFLAAALPVVAAAVLLASWRAAIPNREDEDYFTVLSVAQLLHHAALRLAPIVQETFRLTFLWFDWGGFWIVFLAVLIAGHRALRRRLPRRLLLAGVAPPAIGWAAYAASTRFFRLIFETWDRFLIQSLVPLLLVFACCLAQTLRELRAGRPARGRKLPAAGVKM